MEVKIREATSNELVIDSARLTVWKDSLGKEPSKKFMQSIYMSEHSPIRTKVFYLEVFGVKSFVATHFVRHHVGSTPFVSTCRDDRIQYEEDRVPDRNTPVNFAMFINSQGLIDMSKKRLCHMAHKEAVALMKLIKEKVAEIDPELAQVMVKNCVYRCGCPEGPNGCKYVLTDAFIKERREYESYGLIVNEGLYENQSEK